MAVRPYPLVMSRIGHFFRSVDGNRRPGALLLACGMLAQVCLLGCEGQAGSDAALVLPPGDAEAGRAAFLALRCNDCHSAQGVTLRDAVATDIHVALGDGRSGIRGQAQLLTAILNPAHRVSVPLTRQQLGEANQSPMPQYSDVMTVQELIDLVAFLGPQFGVR